MPDPLAPSNPRLRWLYVCAALVAASIALWPSLSGQFVYDDLSLVVQNPSLRSWSALVASWKGAFWDVARSEVALPTGFWRPLTSVVLFIGYQIGGGEPLAFHVLSLSTHLACVVVAFVLAERLTRNLAIAFATALLFGVHPAVVEPVSWISAINDPVAALAVLLGAWSYLRWRARGSPGVPIGTALALFIGLLAKESAAALAPICVALDFARAERAGDDSPPARSARTIRAYAPLAAAALAYFGLRCLAFDSWRGGLDFSNAHLELTLARRLTLRIEMLGGFLRLAFAPTALALFRDVRPEIPAFDGALLLAGLLIAVYLAAVIIAWRKRAKAILVGLLWVAAGVAPVFVNVEAPGRCAISERFLYVSIFGAALCSACLLARLRPTFVSFGALALLALLAGAKSRARTASWHDPKALFTQAALDSPMSPYVFNGLGNVLLQEFQDAPQEAKSGAVLDSAMQAFVKSQDLGGRVDASKPRDPTILVALDDRLNANIGYGWCMLMCAVYMPAECTIDEAQKVFERILSFYPLSAEAHVGLGMCAMQSGALQRAHEELSRATELNSKSATVWFDLGSVEAALGRFDRAAEAFNRGHSIDPTNRALWLKFASSLAESGQEGRALDELARIRELNPADKEALLISAQVAAKLQRFPDALLWLDRALQIDGNFGPAFLERAKVYAGLGQIDRAPADFDRACSRMPTSFEAHYWFGIWLAKRGAEAEAVPYLQRALDLEPEGPHAGELKSEIERCKAAAAQATPQTNGK